MYRPNFKLSWLRLSQWGALMLGAAFASNAWAGRPDLLTPERTGVPSNQRGPQFDEVLVRIEGTKIYISEGGSAFEELSLGETLDAAGLRKLLTDAGAAKIAIAVPVGSIVVASGGGSGDGAKPKPPATSTTATGTGQKDTHSRGRGAPR